MRLAEKKQVKELLEKWDRRGDKGKGAERDLFPKEKGNE